MKTRLLVARASLVVGLLSTHRSPCQRIGPDLQVVNLGLRLLTPFVMERGARAKRRPQSAPLPAGILVVDAAVHVLREEAHWVRYPQIDQLAVRERQEGLAAIGRCDRHVRP